MIHSSDIMIDKDGGMKERKNQNKNPQGRIAIMEYNGRDIS